MLDPIAFQLGPISVHWYGILYGVSLILGVWMLIWLNKKRPVLKDNNQIFDLAIWVFLIGVVLGGRLGYILFYNLPYYLQNPAKMFAIWEGGMSFHGGLLASLLIGYFYCKKNRINFLALADLVAIPAALAQGIGRIGNFINAELVGRPIQNGTWNFLGVNSGDGVLRFPSQIFQSLSLIILFLILLFLFNRTRKKGVILFSYLALNGLFRFITEFWREPDSQIGLIFKYLTLGQLLAILVTMGGISGLILFRKRH